MHGTCASEFFPVALLFWILFHHPVVCSQLRDYSKAVHNLFAPAPSIRHCPVTALNGPFLSHCPHYSAREGPVIPLTTCSSVSHVLPGCHIFLDSCIPACIPAKSRILSGNHLPHSTLNINAAPFVPACMKFCNSQSLRTSARTAPFLSQCSPYIAREGLVSSFSHCSPLPNPGSGSHLFLDSCIPACAPAKSGHTATSPHSMSSTSTLAHPFTHPSPVDDFSALSVSCPPLSAPAKPGCNSGALPI